MPAAKHSNREMELKVGSEGRKGADDKTHVDRLREKNGFAAHERVPHSVPGPDANFRELWLGEGRDPRKWLAPGGGAAPGHAFDNDMPARDRHAYEAYIRSTGDVVEFVHTQRFRNDDGDPVAEGSSVRKLRTVDPHGALPTLMRHMRAGPLVYGTDDEVEEALGVAREVFGEHRQTPAVLSEDAHAFPVEDRDDPKRSTRHIAILWDFIQGINARVVRMQAAQRKPPEMVYTIAAYDACSGGHPLTPDELRVLRHHPNPNNTGSRMGVLSIFEGMRVELSTKLDRLLKSSAGTIKHVILHPSENTAWRKENSPQLRDGEVVLCHIPSLLVQLDDHEGGPIKGHPGLVLLEPTRSQKFKWDWKTQRTLSSKVTRDQIALLPTSGLTPYTAQGLTAEWALLHVERAQRESIYEWWYKLYVGGSRVRHSSRVGVHGPVPPEFLRALLVGPEPHIIAELGRLRDRATKTRPKINAIARAMRWPAECV